MIQLVSVVFALINPLNIALILSDIIKLDSGNSNVVKSFSG